MSGKLIVVAGGQYGSEAKGHVSEMLLSPSRVGDQGVGVRVGGPNAGHIVYGNCPLNCNPDTEEIGGAMGWGNEPKADHHFNGSWIGHPWKLRQIPVAAVTNPSCDLVIAAGSEVHQPTLMEELRALDLAGYSAASRLRIDSSATVLTEHHVNVEKGSDLTQRLGSTSKGVGAARADRIWRQAPTWGSESAGAFSYDNTAGWLREQLDGGRTVLIEGTQGYGLGVHGPAYPQSTSGDCRAVDFLSQAGLSPWHDSVGVFDPWVVLRVRPIRVAGNSGPMKGETSWAELGLPEEKTTVTRKVRRVGGWDPELAREAIEANGGSRVRVALSMVDTVLPAVASASRWDDLGDLQQADLRRYLEQIETDLRHPVQWIGTSPVTGIWVR